jgi:hypothetical protein
LHQYVDFRCEKSLGLLMQNFMHLFIKNHVLISTCFPLYLISWWNLTFHISFMQVQVVPLENASRLLLGECTESTKLKSKRFTLSSSILFLRSFQMVKPNYFIAFSISFFFQIKVIIQHCKILSFLNLIEKVNNFFTQVLHVLWRKYYQVVTLL